MSIRSIFFSKVVKKLYPKVVTVTMDDHEGSHFTQKIEIPVGWNYIEDFMSDRLIDENGLVRKTFDWRAGYTVTREYSY